MMSWPSVTFASLIPARMGESAGPVLATTMSVDAQQDSMAQSASTELMPAMGIHVIMVGPARCLRPADMRKSSDLIKTMYLFDI